MSAGRTQDISRLLAAWSDGDQQAIDELMAIVYPKSERSPGNA